MTNERKALESHIAMLMEAAVDEQSIMRLLGPESDQDEVLNRIVAISDNYRQVFEAQHPELLLSGRDLEDKGAQFLELPPADELLTIGMHIEQFRRHIVERLHISTEELIALQGSSSGKAANHENLIVVDQVHTPPDFLMPTKGEGDGDPMIIEFSERLTAFRYLLYSLGLDPDDSEQVIMQIGRVGEDMMRRVSYISVLVKPLNRLVELCNQVGNRSFIWKTDKKEEIDSFASLSKEEKKILLDADQNRGWDIVMSKGWLEKMRICLEEDGSAIEPHTPRAPRILEDMRDAEQAADIVRSILESERVLHIEERKEHGKIVRVLVWHKTINPNKKYNGHDFALNILLGRIVGVSGRAKYRSYSSILDPVRSLYQGQFDREEAANPDMQFQMADQQERGQMIRSILEEEGVLHIDMREEEGKLVRVLVWDKTINPNKKYSGHDSAWNILLGRLLNMDGSRICTSFSSILDPVRSLYQGQFDREEAANPDMQFQMADQQERGQMIRFILESEGVLHIDVRGKEDIPVRVLVWDKMINPNKKYNGHNSPFYTLLGRVMDVEGGEIYLSFSSILDPVRSLYQGQFDREEAANPDMQFQMADQQERGQMIRSILEEEGVLHIDMREEEGKLMRVLVWDKTIRTDKKYSGHSSDLLILLGNVMGVDGAKMYRPFPSILDPVRSLYQGQFDREEGVNPDMQFQIADQQHKEQMIRSLLESAGILHINSQKEGEECIRKLVWKKNINPQKRYGPYLSRFNILLGNLRSVSGGKMYTSFSSVVDPIRSLYQGQFDSEEWHIKKPKDETEIQK